MNWTHHHTGHDTWNPKGNGNGWYINRNSKSKRWTFIRWSTRRVNIRLFLGYMNHLRDVGGWGVEFSPTIGRVINFQVGLAFPEGWNPLYWKLNPHMNVPKRRWFIQRRNHHGHYSFRLGWFCLGFYLPKFVERWLTEREWRRWAVSHPEYEAECSPTRDDDTGGEDE